MKIGNWKFENSKDGFTLIETLVVAAITVVVAVAGFLSLSGYRNQQALESGLDELRAAVEATKRRSVAQEQGSRWGMRFTNATSGVSSYAVFKGSSYSTSGVDRMYSFRAPVKFGNPSASSTYDAVFAPLSGALSENKVLTLIGASSGLIGDLILRAVGSITARVDNGVVGYWHLDEGTSTLAYDASGNANTGTLTNGPTWQSGSSCRAGSCLNFSQATGDSIYVEVADSASLKPTTAITVAAWFKTSQADDWDGIVEKANNGGTVTDGYSIRIAGGRFFFTVKTAGGSVDFDSGTSVVDGAWHHGVGTYGNGTVKVYVDGVLKLTSTSGASGNIVQAARPLYLGRGARTGFNRGFNGTIDEVRVWNRALSASEIEALYNDLK